MKKKRLISVLEAKYTKLHEGRSPDRIFKQRLPRQPKYLVELGPIPEQMYLKKTAEPGAGENPPAYRHPYAPWAMPTLAHDERGKLHILDQENIVVTERGIEDKHMKRRHHSSILRANPVHYSHRGHRMLSARHNPLNAETFKKVAVSSLAVGVGASAVAIGMKELFARVSQLNGLTPYTQAALQAGIGLVAATALQSAGQETLAAIVGVGGVSAGTLGAYQQYRTASAGSVMATPRLVAPAAGVSPVNPQVCYAAR